MCVQYESNPPLEIQDMLWTTLLVSKACQNLFLAQRWEIKGYNPQTAHLHPLSDMCVCNVKEISP